MAFLLLMGLMFTGLLNDVLWPLINIAVEGGVLAANLPIECGCRQLISNLFGG